MEINQTWLVILQALIPLVAAVITLSFKLSQSQRETLGHAVDRALALLRDGKITGIEAKSAILATGAAAANKVDKLVDAVELRMNGAVLEAHSQNLIPGVTVSVDTGGNFAVNPTGAMNKAAHKLNKWIKTKTGLKVF